MKRIYFASLFLLLNTTFLFSQSNPVSLANQTNPKAQARILDTYGKLPLSFEANHGQTDARVKFLSRGGGYSFFLTQSGAVLSFAQDAHSPAVLQMQLAGSNANARVYGVDELPGKSNYFFGNAAERWRTGVSTYSRVAYDDVYPGINLLYYGNQRQLEYDFDVAPGANPNQIRLAVSGAEDLTVDSNGNLVLRNASGQVHLLAPKVYQVVRGKKQEIAGRWKLKSANVAGFRLGRYDHSRALVIDPVLLYSSFLGGSQKNTLNKVAIDAAGNTYVAGYTTSGDFPAAPTPQAVTFGNGTQLRGAFVSKIDPTGATLLYSTYLSGNADEEASGLAVDASGNVYVAGTTHSTDFPTYNAFQSTCATNNAAGTCTSAFLTKISPTGDSLVFSTYLGGSGGESARGLAIDAQGSAYVVGITSSLDFPVTTGAAQPKCGGQCQQNGFVAKFDPTGGSLVYATYLGGSGIDDTADIAVDSSANVYVTGRTTSPDFPLATPYQKGCTPDAASTSGACVATAYVSKIKADGSALAYSTFLGGSLGSQASAIAVDSAGSAYVTGSTQSSDFPVLKPFQKSCGIGAASTKCSVDAFLTKFAPTGKTLIYSTYLGGSGRDEASGIVVDAGGNAHLVGRTESSDFPTVASVQSKLKGTSDAFAVRFNASGSTLAFSTYHGGSGTESGNAIALDTKGNIYLAGETSSPDFPTSHPFQSSCAGSCSSAFISKMALPQGVTVSTTVLTSDINPSTYGQTVTFTATVTGASGIPTGTVNFLDGVTVLDTGTLSGTGATTFTTTAPSAGSHSMTAVYSGDSTYASSTSSAIPQTVDAAATTTNLTAVPASPSTFGQSVTFTATVAVVAPGTGTPIGTVNFDASGTAIARCTGVAVSGTGQAVCTTSALNAASYTVKATYTEIGGNFTGSNGTRAYTVNAASTTTTVTAVPSSATLGQSVTFTATVAPVAPGAGTPPGTVDFTDGGTAITGCTGVALSGGTANCATSTLTAGSHTIKGTYTPTGTNFVGSNGSLTYTVGPPATITTVTAAPVSPSTYGQSVVFTATVAVVAPGTGTPTGTVDFAANGTAISGCTGVALGSGRATCPTSTLSAGSNAIKATYNPSGNSYATSNGTLSYAVNPASTTTAVNSSVNPSVPGQAVTFSTTVSAVPSGVGTPTGQVQLVIDSANVGIPVTLVSGSASFPPISSLTAGSHGITATYSGDPNFLGSTSGALIQQVNSTTVATLSPTSLNFGNVAIGTQSLPKSVKLTNPGTIPLNIINVNPGGTGVFKIASNTCWATLAPGKSCWVSVVFAPNEPGPVDTDTLSFYDDAANSPQTAPLSGTVVAQVTWSPASLTFAAQAVGTTSAPKIVTLTNNLPTAQSINSISFTGTDPGEFAQINTCGGSVAAKAKCTISVTFSPQANGSRKATLNVSDSASNSPQTVPLTGTGVVPATLAPISATYAAQAEGTTSAAKTFTLTNNQTVPLTGMAISTTGDFAVSATTCTTSLAAKGKCTVSVTFTPTAAGKRTGQLSLSDSASNSPQTATLTGTGTVPATLTPANFTYATQKVGTTSVPKTFTLANKQSVALTGIAISVSAPFAVSATTCTTSLAPSATCTISVTFTPEAAESFEAALFAYDSASTSPQFSFLLGTGK